MRYLALAVFAIICAALVAAFNPSPKLLPDSSVKILVGDGHGSGVHIGDGLILTAAHVVNVGAPTVVLSDGTTQTASILWVNNSHDVALIKTEPSMSRSELACREPVVREAVTATGNPLFVDFVTTAGSVIGKTRKIDRWEAAFPIDAVFIMGMSGGPVFDRYGAIIGIGVGAVVYNAGVVGIGFAVPTNVICEMLARR